MKTLCLYFTSILLSLCTISNAQETYYDFPFDGWSQTFLSTIWTGIQLQEGIATMSNLGDSIVEGVTYQEVNQELYRHDNGKLFRLEFTGGGPTGYEEILLFDFTLNIADTVLTHFITQQDSILVIAKEKILNSANDSVWYLELSSIKPFSYDTIKWLEGVGDVQNGILTLFFPDGALAHMCTRNKLDQRISDVGASFYCNCDYAFGQDLDNDGFGNHQIKTRIIDYGFYAEGHTKVFKAKKCDTLIVASDQELQLYFSPHYNCDSISFSFDEYEFSDNQHRYTLYDTRDNDRLYISDQCVDIGYIDLIDCVQNDCDDTDPLVPSEALAIFDIGTKWTYEFFPEVINPAHIVHSYTTYEIMDTIRIEGDLAYDLGGNNYMKQECEEIYFWDNQKSFWQLTYDFGAIDSYQTQWDTNHVEVLIDNITDFNFGDRGNTHIQTISIENNGTTFPDPLVHDILSNCGKLDGGMRLQLGEGLLDLPYYTGRLRCFEQGDFFFNFDPSIPCDTVYTEILDAISELERQQITISPNPTSGSISIGGLKKVSEYEIYTSLGQMVQHGRVLNGTIELNDAGIYFVRVFVDDRWIVNTVVVLD